MMDVLYDHQIFSLQRHGGISRYFFQLIRSLSNLSDLRLNLFLGLHKSTLPFHELVSQKTEIIDFRKAPYIPFRIRSAVNDFRFGIHAHKYQKACYHPTYYGGGPSTLRSIKKVITVFDMIHEIFPAGFPQNDRTSDMKRRAVETADAVITISNRTKEDLIDILKVPERKVAVIYPGIHDLTPIIPAQPVPEKWVDGNRNYILYIGDRWFYKNVPLFLKAFSRSGLSKHKKIVFFGGRPFGKQDWEHVSEANLKGCVEWVSGNDSTLAYIYQNALFMVYPSLYEGFGMPILEAMSLDCPVLSSSSPALVETGGDAALYFDASSIEDLSEKMVSLADNPSLRESLKTKGQERASQFSWEGPAAMTRDIYLA